MSAARWMVREAWRAVPLKAKMLHAVRALRMPLPERVWKHLHFEGLITVSPAPGVVFEMRHYGHSLENSLFWVGYGNGWEATSLKLWARLAQHAATVLDIGANTGVFALAACAVNPTARVVAFEPAARIHSKLMRNATLNGFALEAVCAGVSDRDGMLTFYDTATEHAYSASLERSMLAGRTDVLETTITVTRADTALHGAAGPVLAKIDTERHELAVLDGFGDALARLRPTLLIEILDIATGAAVAERLDGLDYALYDIEEGVGLTRVVRPGLTGRNHLLIPAEAVAREGFGKTVCHSDL